MEREDEARRVSVAAPTYTNPLQAPPPPPHQSPHQCKASNCPDKLQRTLRETLHMTSFARWRPWQKK
ncbi:hypothetical protein Pcinc_001003 [Petrolisthes cinctipes]|uniref:Uncharacterized protein n=1 Tax=Petrolisthes cinctipes TaxID=88211 RepID=A0AAE1L4Y2_PETCI|nr:hypothetical protein Pcinc_001003 [Petrolisthes cinctipes]